VLLSITSGTDLADPEIGQISAIIWQATGKRARLLVSVLTNPLLGNDLKIVAISVFDEPAHDARIGAKFRTLDSGLDASCPK
jgi:hypothetical protein